MRTSRVWSVLAVLVMLASGIVTAAAEAPANDPFQQTWQRTDYPVATAHVNRTWMWGPEAFTGAFFEEYAESPVGLRTVQYFDKSRMEITYPNAVDDGVWYVTNGLLVVEMVEGYVHTGDIERDHSVTPAEGNIAGDAGQHPTYADIDRFALREQPARDEGALVNQWSDEHGIRDAGPNELPEFIYATKRVTVPGIDHTVASVFWEFMIGSGRVYENGQFITANLFQNPFYATGYPITEAYWSVLNVGGESRPILWQCFERRCLTYNLTNPDGWQVEAGNVGRHYYAWRYDASTPQPEPEPTDGTATVTHVVDGDTIDVEIDGETYRVRYIGIDTPETHGGTDCYGPEASAANANLVMGQTVRLEQDVSETDRYGRLLRYVWVDDTFVNDWLVRNGYAYASTYPPDVAYAEQFAAAQSEAQANGRGLWSACVEEPEPPPMPEPDPDPPSGNCHASYPTVCIPPPPPDLDCGDIPYTNFQVVGSDPHRFDGDNDAVGCED